MDCNCPEEGSELGIPSHTALSRSALAEVLLAVLKAHSSLTPSGDAHPDPCPIVITHNCDLGGSSEDTHGKAKQKEYNAAFYQRGSRDESG